MLLIDNAKTTTKSSTQTATNAFFLQVAGVFTGSVCVCVTLETGAGETLVFSTTDPTACKIDLPDNASYFAKFAGTSESGVTVSAVS